MECSTISDLSRCSEQDFENYINGLEEKSLLEAIACLQREMASEQAKFEAVSSRLDAVSDPDSPEYGNLSAELMAVQANLATLMSRNMKCFDQQTQNKDKAALTDQSEENKSESDVELQNGETVRLLNGHRHKLSPRESRGPRPRRPRGDFEEGEPDVAGHEEILQLDHKEDTNGNQRLIELLPGSEPGGLHADPRLAGIRRRDILSPDSQHFIDFGQVGGESSTDTGFEGEIDSRGDTVTVEKNRKNERNEARCDDKEDIEWKAQESLKRFDVAGTDYNPHQKQPSRLFLVENVTKGESYTDEGVDDDFREIDVDRIGEEDEGEEDDPSEWKYAADGFNKTPHGPVVHASAAGAKVLAETRVRRQSQNDADDAVTSAADVYDVKRSTADAVMRSADQQESDDGSVATSGGATAYVVPPGVTILKEESTSQEPLSSTETSSDKPICDSVDTPKDVTDATQAGGTAVSTPPLPGTAPGSTPTVPQEGDENSPTEYSNGTLSSSATPPHTPIDSQSPEKVQGQRERLGEQQEEPVNQGAQSSVDGSDGADAGRGVVATSTATLTLRTVPRVPDPSDVSQPSSSQVSSPPSRITKISRITIGTVSSASRAPRNTQEQEAEGKKERSGDGQEGIEESDGVSKSSPQVHFRSYASFCPSESGDGEGTSVWLSEQEKSQAGGLAEQIPQPDGQTGTLHSDSMGNALDKQKNNGAGTNRTFYKNAGEDRSRKEPDPDNISSKSAVTPACLPSEGFTADDKVKDRTTLKDWDPTDLMKELYKIELVPDEEEDFFEHISMEGYMEKLPINKKKATLLKTWKRRYFRAHEGFLHYYEPPDTVRPKAEDSKDSEKPSGSIQLTGGSIEALDSRMIGIDDGRGRYLIVRAPSEIEYDDWLRALKSQTIENIRNIWVKPVVHAIPSRKRNVIIIDIGSCSVRAGILGEQPSLPSLFFPCIMATSRETGDRVFGFEALLPNTRSTCTLSYPVRPSVKVDKFAVDMAAMPELFDKIFNELDVEPSNHWIMFSAPGNFSDKIKQHFMDILVNRFHVIGVNIVAQTLLSLYSYNSRSGIVVDVGERLEIVPVTDGYIVEAGVTRQPYGGHRITEALNSSFTESKYRFFTDVEFQIVRLAMERSCFVSSDYNTELRACQENPRAFKKTIQLGHFGLPPGTWKNVTHNQSRFTSTEGLFNTELWGMDNPLMHKLVAKAVQVCPMDLRREMWRSIFLSGGVTLLPGFAERLQQELTKLAPPTVKVQVHASPQRYHSAYIGACALANLKEFEQACITADEWREAGPASLRKWHMY